MAPHERQSFAVVFVPFPIAILAFPAAIALYQAMRTAMCRRFPTYTHIIDAPSLFILSNFRKLQLQLIIVA
jgi:hypothetical protein